MSRFTTGFRDPYLSNVFPVGTSVAVAPLTA
jgi:hypothetical protein